MEEKNKLIQECLPGIKKDKEELAYVERMLKEVEENAEEFQTVKKSRQSSRKVTETVKSVKSQETLSQKERDTQKKNSKEQEVIKVTDIEEEIRYTQKWDESDVQDSESEGEEEVISKPKRPPPIVLREQGRLSVIRKEAEANNIKILNEEEALKVVLRGIPTDFSEEDVQGELEEQGFPVLKVKRMKRFKEDMPMMLVDVKKSDEGKKLFALKEVVGMKIKAEAKRKPTSSAQCFRCQMYGHVQYRCTAAHKCVRCAEEHPSRECPLKGKKNINPKCANCGGQHHAASRDCPEHPPKLKRKGRRKREKRLVKGGQHHAASRDCPEHPPKLKRKGRRKREKRLVKPKEKKVRVIPRWMAGFQTITEDRVTAPGGGVAVLVKNKLAARKVRFQTRIEAVGAAVKIEGKEVLVVNPNGKKLQQWLNQNPRIQMKAPAEHTYYPENGRMSDVLDIFLTKALPMSDAVTKMKLDSDHCPVIIELKAGFTPRRKMTKKINWMKFISLCSKLQYQEENAAKQLTEDIQRVLRECEVERPVSFTDRWELNDREKALLKKKYEAKQRWSKTRSVSDKRELNQLKRKVDDMIAQKKEEHLGKTVDGIQENPTSLWPLLRRMGGGSQPNAPIRFDNRWLYEDQEKAEAIAGQLEMQFRFVQTAPEKIRGDVMEEVVKIDHAVVQDPPEIRKDELQNLMGESATYELLKIVNAVFKWANFPNIWKLATIVTIPKGGKDPTVIENRRPINLLDGFSKITKRMLKDKIETFLEEHELIPKNQFGFRQGPRKVAVAAFVDVEKAYDKVWREAVVFKMRKLGVPIELIKVTRSWLEGRRFRVKLQKAVSRERIALEGLPQGSPLSPLLFNIFVLDLPNAIAVPTARVFQFADDTAIVVQGLNLESSLKKLEQGLKEVGVFAANWNMKINESKTEVVKFTKKIPRRQFILWNSRKIKVKNLANYLGITVDNRLSFDSHVRRRGVLAAASMMKLYPIVLRLEEEESWQLQVYWELPVGYQERGNQRAVPAGRFEGAARFIGNFPWVTRNAEIRELFQLEDLRERAMRRTEAGIRMSNHPSAQIQGFGAKIS
ncbi:Reverse transcriptase (RNA-dependent DNA polymerase) [Popillia japonica]|uniref:Reverse transcriptase (RNA-dependent DNA polymerase) n=1 Tax=Popillia japonica TaxID=7064 RepID=A0AAW1JYW4_POPJA